jgi:prepilin-type N-terminal cleavage/methylation domain-containing protein
MKLITYKSAYRTSSSAFTLIELLVVIVIIGILAALVVPALSKAQQKAAETKSVAALRNVLQASALYSAENNGQIAMLRYSGETAILNPGGKWVGNTFWGLLQPYLFPDITTANQSQLLAQMRPRLNKLFGSSDYTKMKGTPFQGGRIYADTSGLSVPFGFNRYLMPWNTWSRQQQIYSLPATIHMTYGFAGFDEVDAEAYQPMAKLGESVANNIYYLPTQRAIAGFLDGRVEFLKPPVAEKMVLITAPEE